ncbi:MAG: 16S rRNA (guanine(966)-N(2))-methyltransferase RsmD [Burkholderiales bacterium]|nr:16S rRNA (guanine(966)-N(2))-methyltransferase RsmD [Burkholderiales bacterium]
MREARPPKRPHGVLPSANPGLTAAQKVARHAAQEVRIIGGQWKRTPLTVPVSAGLRPTPSRVRETLFNWLGQDLSGWTVLDAFAGSGALGLEAASRGAQAVTLVERDPILVKAIRSSVDKLKAQQVTVQQGEAVSWMQQAARQGRVFDLVFLDPPFDDDLFASAIQAARACVPEGGWIYVEAPHALVLGAEIGLQLARQGKAGAVHFHLFQRMGEAG